VRKTFGGVVGEWYFGWVRDGITKLPRYERWHNTDLRGSTFRSLKSRTSIPFKRETSPREYGFSQRQSTTRPESM